ncbi:MAG: hypothetical protein DPW16_07545 [Chloroflexi bacterium]|nr:hypothetical protein [Chloroflexota bacterium]
MIGKWPFILLFLGTMLVIGGVFAASTCIDYLDSDESDTCKGNINDGALFDFRSFEGSETLFQRDATFADGLARNFVGLNVLVGAGAALIIFMVHPKEAIGIWIVALVNIGLIGNTYFWSYQTFYKNNPNDDFIKISLGMGWYLMATGAGLMLVAALFATYNLQKSPLEEFDEEIDEYEGENDDENESE